MGTVRRAARNFLSLSAAQIMSQAILFLIIIYLARILGAAGFGKIAFAQAVVLYFSLLANLGLSTLGTREVARNRGEMDSYVGNENPCSIGNRSNAFPITYLSHFLLRTICLKQ